MYEDVAGIESWYLDADGQPPEFPLRVVPDWDAQVRRAAKICLLIDRHLDHKAGGRRLSDGGTFCPRDLCAEQRVQMIAELYAGMG